MFHAIQVSDDECHVTEPFNCAAHVFLRSDPAADGCHAHNPRSRALPRCSASSTSLDYHRGEPPALGLLGVDGNGCTLLAGLKPGRVSRASVVWLEPAVVRANHSILSRSPASTTLRRSINCSSRTNMAR